MNNNPMQFLQQQLQTLQSNPAQFFGKMRLDIPQNIVNNPDAILQHFLETGKFSQEQVNRAYQAFYNMRK